MFLKNVIYIASCTKEGGIFEFEFNNQKLYSQKGITYIDSPMYMIMSKNKMHILLRSPFKNSQSGYINFGISESGKLFEPSNLISTKGEIACHLTSFNENIFCVNYASGDVTKIGGKTINHNRIDLPISHPHYVVATPDCKYLSVTDLGQDLIYIYDENLNCVKKNELPIGHGVRHLAFSKDGKYIFTANELKSTVSVLEYNNGNMRLIDTKSSLPKDYNVESFASAIRIYKNYIYVANRGHNSISKLSFNKKELKFIDSFDCKGKTPRDFIFHDNRIICANQDSDSVTVFEEKPNGKFEFIQQINIEKPMCVI